MSRAQLEASKALWLARERYRYAKWRSYHRKGSNLTSKWWNLYQEAHRNRMRREHQLAAFIDKPRTISDDGVNLIAEFEGFVGHPYRDAVGVWTIGYGHTAGVNASSPHITEAQGQALLRRDLEGTYVPAVRSVVKTSVRQNEFDALVSLAYNIGATAFGSSTLLRKLNAGDKRGAADEFLKWNRGGGKVLPGLTRRREQERALFLK